jgi:hypothetical protein
VDATHGSLRSMARAVGHAPSTIHRIWRAFGLQPHRSETFKPSTDPLFVEKVRDIVGLYLAPPERAMVLCVDEKSQIQALDRSQPLLPIRPGQAERRSHDYTRHGTLSLFAALDTATGNVVGRCFARHRTREFRAFLNTIEAHVPSIAPPRNSKPPSKPNLHRRRQRQSKALRLDKVGRPHPRQPQALLSRNPKDR